MNGHLLDTSVLIAPDPNGLGELPTAAAISVITLGELHAGVLLASDEGVRSASRGRLEAVRAAFAPIPVDEPIAERYGEILAVARSQRRTAKATDLLILATADVHDRILHTRDGRQAALGRAARISVRTV